MWASEASICSHDHGDSTPVSHVLQGLVEERNFLKFGESEREQEREVKWEKVEKKINETWIDDVATFTTIGLNQWLILELLHPMQYLSYCTGCESIVFRHHLDNLGTKDESSQ